MIAQLTPSSFLIPSLGMICSTWLLKHLDRDLLLLVDLRRIAESDLGGPQALPDLVDLHSATLAAEASC